MAFMLIEGVTLLFEKQQYMLKCEMVIRKAKILLPASASYIMLGEVKPYVCKQPEMSRLRIVLPKMTSTLPLHDREGRDAFKDDVHQFSPTRKKVLPTLNSSLLSLILRIASGHLSRAVV